MEWTQEALLAAEHDLERDAIERGRERYRKLLEQRKAEDTEVGQELIRRTVGSVIQGIEQWQTDALSGIPGRGAGLAKAVAQYDADELALITLRHVVSALHSADATLTGCALAIVQDMEAIDLEARLKAADRSAFRRYQRACARRSYKDNAARRMGILRKQGQYVGAFTAKAEFSWKASERVRVGVRLLEIARDATGVFEWARVNDPADKGKRTAHPAYYLRATERWAEWIEHAHASLELSRPVLYPMVVEPRPWNDMRDGGYLSRGRAFSRPLVKVQAGPHREEMQNVEMPLITEAVNALQRVRFAVNTRVLDVVEKNLGTGSSMSGRPGDLFEVKLPERMPFMDRESDTWTEAEKEAFKDWKTKTRDAKSMRGLQQAHLRTSRTTAGIARDLCKYPALYYPVRMDFRGRTYPIPAYLHPQGNDLAKGLLQFADAVPLGEDGLRWLAIHIANCFGVDKVPFEQREQWTRDHYAEIAADAADPHREGALWVKADSPVQFLAAAFEWADIGRHAAEHGEVSSFRSHIPVGLDGSCNGLQHFSAMLRDPVGGAATNLIPGDRPSDIYTRVAERARSLCELDMMGDDPVRARYARFWLAKGIDRRWTKRNTMTVPYGVTAMGMKDQLWAEIGRLDRNFFGAEYIDHGEVVRYLASINWGAISRVVVAAVRAMGWLAKVAEAVTGTGAAVRWVTPDGFPVMQRYLMRDEIKVALYGGRLTLALRPFNDQTNRVKQRMAVAPNFVHSIDASHMRAVTRRLARMGINAMSMVHDSFAVHAGHVETLSQVIREEFVALHSEPLLQRFLEANAPVIGDALEKVPPLPPSGDLDLEAVKRSRYFFA